MLSVDEREEAFFDTTDVLLFEEESDVVEKVLDYDVWLREPQSVSERRRNFVSRMGMSECSISPKSELSEIVSVDEASERIDDSLMSERRKSNSEANCSVDYSNSSQGWSDDNDMCLDVNVIMDEMVAHDKQCVSESVTVGKSKTRMMRWWSSFSRKMKKNHVVDASKDSMIRKRMEQNRKRCVECSAVYGGQVVKAHDGVIWTMKFSPDGQYLASGGQDGVVCIWHLKMVDVSCKAKECCYGSHDVEGKLNTLSNKSSRASIVIPEKMFHIEEEPLQRLKGHRSNVLDLAWSKSNHLLSSSMDKTVRLWVADSDECLAVFHHNNYVTCVQFNPADESHFISGCIDGKVRIWGVSSRRVEEWANIQDIVTAVCYQPNGRGFVVGSLSGNCRFYESSGDELILSTDINIRGRKKSSGNKISGIQFVNNKSRRMMITSEDSKIRIFDGIEVVRKYKGLTKSGGQMSASFTSSGRHIVSIGEDSRIYIWNYDDPCIQPSKEAKSVRSCESFVSEGASVVLNWSDSVTGNEGAACRSPRSVLECDYLESPPMQDSDRFSLSNWFTMDSSSRGSATWPEEKLPLSELESTGHEKTRGARCISLTWGLVFVSANLDGTIKTFHNYGLPVRT